MAIDESAAEAPENLAFGRFQVLRHRRELLADRRPIKLGGRAFDVLMALIEVRKACASMLNCYYGTTRAVPARPPK